MSHKRGINNTRFLTLDICAVRKYASLILPGTHFYSGGKEKERENMCACACVIC
jgi:hypothetical protein